MPEVSSLAIRSTYRRRDSCVNQCCDLTNVRHSTTTSDAQDAAPKEERRLTHLASLLLPLRRVTVPDKKGRQPLASHLVAHEIKWKAKDAEHTARLHQQAPELLRIARALQVIGHDLSTGHAVSRSILRPAVLHRMDHGEHSWLAQLTLCVTACTEDNRTGQVASAAPVVPVTSY